MHTTRLSLLARLKDGRDAAAWEEFDVLYRPLLYRYATARGLQHSEAEDVVQQCLAAVHRHIAGFEYDPRKGRFKSWLRTLVNNRVRNFFRNRREAVADTRDFERDQQREPAPEEVFERVWLDEHLRHALTWVQDQVEDNTFAAFQAYVIEEQSVEEVCRRFDMTPNQVYKIKWRVTQKLSEKMRELLDETE